MTRVLVSRQSADDHRPEGLGDDHLPGAEDGAATDRGSVADHGLAGDHDPSPDHGPGADDPSSAAGDPTGVAGLQRRLRAAMALLPPTLGRAPRQPLEVGRATRVVHSAQRAALVVRDGGCVFPGCDRPLAWCDAHHLWHWVDGGPTDLSNLALVCRAHHRRVHEEGWQLTRGPDGRFTATPTPTHRRHRTVA